MNKNKLTIFVVILMVLTSCATDLPSDKKPETLEQTSYPIESGVSVYPVPESENLNAPTLMPIEMNAGTGVVEATFLLSGKPVQGMNFYLASYILDKNGNEVVASVSPQSSPFSVSDSSGRVRFNNVPIGKYGFVLEVDISSYLLLTPNGDRDLSAVVEDQKISDLGVLNYQDLPINP